MDYIISKYHGVSDFYTWAISISDKRVKDWPLMSSPLPTLLLTFTYIGIIKYGPLFMENRPPLQFRKALFLYNAAVVLLNLYIGIELAVVSSRLQYSWFCQPVDYSSNVNEIRIAAVLWWYYISKLIEFMDTFIFILRKKINQVTFLHCYHHSTMFCLWWIGIKWVAGGSSFLAAMINSFIHVIMYTYYGLASLGPHVQKYLWWKKHITCLQLVQFVSAGFMGIRAVIVGCDFPLWMQYALVFYMSTLVCLFGKFYVEAYRKQKSKHSSLLNGKAEYPVLCNGYVEDQNDAGSISYKNGAVSDGLSRTSHIQTRSQTRLRKKNI